MSDAGDAPEDKENNDFEDAQEAPDLELAGAAGDDFVMADNEADILAAEAAALQMAADEQQWTDMMNKSMESKSSKKAVAAAKKNRNGVQDNGVEGEIVVNYNSSNHFQILFQKRGSIWPKVLPYCIANALMMFVCDFWIRPAVGEDNPFYISGVAVGYIRIMVSFLVITRLGMAWGRYDKCGTSLQSILSGTRDLVSYVAFHTMSDQSPAAKEWRNKIAYYACLNLRLMVAATDYQSDKFVPWYIAELHGEIKEKLLAHNQLTGYTGKFCHAVRTEKEEVFRFPVTMCQFLSLAMSERTKAGNYALASIEGGFFELTKHYTTPPPFPVAQMSRQVLFIWVFAIPFTLMWDVSPVYIHMIGVFFVTYSFVGIELLSIELDDPFGPDANDFDNIPMAQTVFEDCYAIIDMVDGPAWASRLRMNMNDETEPPAPAEIDYKF